MSSTTYRHYSNVPNSGDVVDSTRQQIDKEVQDLYESARKLKSRRNALAPISRLPPELLSRIFTFLPGLPRRPTYCVALGEFRRTDYSNGTNLWWIKITHVCRHWRSVALSCPSLWSSIVFTRPNWAEEMLKRSKAAPLVVTADLSSMTPRMVDAVQLALQHISRTKQLHLTASKGLMEKLLNGNSMNAPFLQYLCLSNTRHSPHLFDNECYTLPESLFGGDTPRLRHLELTKCNPRWDSPLFSGLTHLQIHYTSASARPTIQQLLSALARMPLLQTLDLQDALPSIPNHIASSSVTGSPVALDHLSSLHLVGLVLECACLLNHITFPITTRLQLVCATVDSTSRDFSGLFPIISSRSDEKEGSKTLQSFLVESVAPCSIRLQGWTSTDHSRSYPAHINLSLTWSGNSEGTAEQVMIDVCKGLSLTQLQILGVGLFRVQKKSWVETFGALTKLHTIQVRGASMSGLVKALVTKVGEKHAERRLSRRKSPPLGGVLFPALRKLVIEDTDFGDEDVDFMDVFRDMLMERKERKVEVQELHLSRCHHLIEANVDILRDLVDVNWDGLEDGLEDDDEDSDDQFSNYDDGSMFGIYDATDYYYFGYGEF